MTDRAAPENGSLILFGGGGGSAFDRAAMRFGVVLGGFAGMVCRMKSVSVSDMRVVRGLFVVPVLVVAGSFAVVSRGMLVMFSSFSVMVGSFVVHGVSSFVEKCAAAGGVAGSAR